MDRHQKLQKLKDNVPKPTTTVEVGESLDKFSQSLELILAKGVQIKNIEDVVAQLEELQSFKNDVKELREVISKIELPNKVGLEGLDDLSKALNSVPDLQKVDDSLGKLDKSFGSISKALNDDIYARYDWANSADGIAGQYIGYLNGSGSWFIQRIGTNASGEKSSRFAAGSSRYAENWRARERLKYELRDKVVIR